jgi:hypothetical protein
MTGESRPRVEETKNFMRTRSEAMDECKKIEQTGVASGDPACTPALEEIAEKMCRGCWRLKPDIVLRVEDDGAILFDADADALSVANGVASALLRWRRDRICFDEWCQALHAHYGPQVERAQIEADVRRFLGQIYPYSECCDGTAT